MARWWYVARFKAGMPKMSRGVEIVFGQVPYSDEFFSPGDEVWLTKEDDERWLVCQPIPGGRVARMTKGAMSRYLTPAQPPSSCVIVGAVESTNAG